MHKEEGKGRINKGEMGTRREGGRGRGMRGYIENIFTGKHFKGIFIGQHGGREGL